MIELIKFNLRGTEFIVIKELLNKYPNSYLTKLINTKNAIKYNFGYYIDRDPKYFNTILDIYRDGLNIIIDKYLMKELEFYELLDDTFYDYYLDKNITILYDINNIYYIKQKISPNTTKSTELFLLPKITSNGDDKMLIPYKGYLISKKLLLSYLPDYINTNNLYNIFSKKLLHENKTIYYISDNDELKILNIIDDINCNKILLELIFK
jgi:hypothetical protein